MSSASRLPRAKEPPYSEYPAYLSQVGGADERTRTADTISLQVSCNGGVLWKTRPSPFNGVGGGPRLRRTPGYRELTEAWEQPASAFRVLPVLVAEAFDQLLLIRQAHQQQREGRGARRRREPVRHQEVQDDGERRSRRVEGMPHPAVGAGGDELVVFPRAGRRGDVLAEAAEDPVEQRQAREPGRRSRPAQGRRKIQPRPAHPARVDHVGQHG